MVTVNAGGFTIGVGPTVPVQCAAAGQVASPPPLAVAVLVTPVALATVGVTGMVKAWLAPTARLAMVQVSTWPLAVQPAGNAPMVKPVGMVSVTVVAAVVAALPPLVTVMV